MQKGEKRWAAQSQIKAVEVVAELQGRIESVKEQYDVLKKCGLEKEAKAKVLPKIHELEKKKLQLMEEINKDRLSGAKTLLMCLCSADLACECADDFADNLNKISYGLYGKNNSFSDDLRKIAMNFNKMVCVIDNEQNLAMSEYYLDMADECIAAAKQAVSQVIEKFMKTKNGEKYF